MLMDRRQFQRLIPDSPSSVCLGNAWSARLFDLSEAGLAVEGLPPARQDQPIPVAFDLPAGGARICATAEIIWAGDSHFRTGLRFLDLADTSRQQLKKWISSRVRAGALAAELDYVPLDMVTPAPGLPASPVSQDWEDDELARLRDSFASVHRTTGFKTTALALVANEQLHRLRKFCPPIALLLVLVVVSPLSVFLGHVLANRANERPAIHTTHPTAAAASASDANPAALVPLRAEAQTLPDSLPFDVPGFVLQVGAMSHENNADVLRESLERRNFPAFVFKRSGGRFYRVAVGPYSDPDAALKIENQLKAEGFESFLRPWSPE
jgi:hypothetical protein